MGNEKLAGKRLNMPRLFDFFSHALKLVLRPTYQTEAQKQLASYAARSCMYKIDINLNHNPVVKHTRRQQQPRCRRVKPFFFHLSRMSHVYWQTAPDCISTVELSEGAFYRTIIIWGAKGWKSSFAAHEAFYALLDAVQSASHWNILQQSGVLLCEVFNIFFLLLPCIAFYLKRSIMWNLRKLS